MHLKQTLWKSSKLETRIFVIFLLCSSLPLLAFAAITYNQLREQAIERSEKELHIASKNYALQLFSRLETTRERLYSLSRLSRDEEARLIKQIPTIADLLPSLDFPDIPKSKNAVLISVDGRLWLGLRINSNARWFNIDINALLYDLEDAPYEHRRCVEIGAELTRCNSQTVTGESLFTRWPLFLNSSFESNVEFAVSSAVSRSTALNTINTVTRVFPVAVLLASLLIAIVAIKLLRSRLLPLKLLENAANNIALGNYAQHIEITSHDELESVAGAFNKMSHKLAASFDLMHELAKIDALILSTSNLTEIVNLILSISQNNFDLKMAFLYSKNADSSSLEIFFLDDDGIFKSSSIDGLSFDDDLDSLQQTVRNETGVNYLSHKPIMSSTYKAGHIFIFNTLHPEAPSSDPNLEQLLDRMSVAVEHCEKSETLFRNANYDTLTGLDNRHSFEGKLAKLISDPLQKNHKIAVLFLDVVRFKQINDTEGRKAGDRLLALLASRLRNTMRPADSIARMGGDEFAIQLTNCGTSQDLSAFCKRLLDTVYNPIMMGETEYRLGITIGLSIYPQDGNTPDELLLNAEGAMYGAKNSRGRGYAFYDQSLNIENQKRARIEMRLRSAIAKDELEMHFQAQLDLKQNIIHSAEALMRWTDSELGAVFPDQFIPIAEEIGVINDMDPIIIDRSIKLINAVKMDLRIAINASPYQLTKGYAKRILKLIEDRGAKPSSFEVEVTESVFIGDLDATVVELNILRAAGVSIALDDFGTGYSSLNLLRELPLDYLKIDRSLIVELTSSSQARDLVYHVIKIAKVLNLKVIAEGTETESEIQILRDIGCDYAQGYGISRPIPSSEFIDFLASQGG